MLTSWVYAVALGAGLALVGLSLATLVNPCFQQIGERLPIPSPEEYELLWVFRVSGIATVISSSR